MPVSPTITFDCDDTLISGRADNDGHCRAIGALWQLLERAPVSLHVVSGREESRRQETRMELAAVGVFPDDNHLHLRPADCLTDQEHKLRCAMELRPLLMIDNSIACAGTLLRAGFCYLRAPGGEAADAHV